MYGFIILITIRLMWPTIDRSDEGSNPTPLSKFPSIILINGPSLIAERDKRGPVDNFPGYFHGEFSKVSREYEKKKICSLLFKNCD